MKPGDMAEMEQEIERAEKSLWHHILLLGVCILVSNVMAAICGVFLGWLIWGI